MVEGRPLHQRWHLSGQSRRTGASFDNVCRSRYPNSVVGAATESKEGYPEVFASLVQFLDDKSVNLSIRDARNDGRKAMKILRVHFKGSSKPRIIGLCHHHENLVYKSVSLTCS